MSGDLSRNNHILRILISSNTTQDSLINTFSKFGKLSRIEFFPNLQMSRQEVLIEFESEHAAKQALNRLDGKTLDNFHLCITYATNEQAKMLQEICLKKEQEIESNENQQISPQKDLEKEIVDDGFDKIINVKQGSELIDVEGLLNKYPELKAQIANPQIFKALYDVFKKEFTKKMEQDVSPISPEKLKEKMKSSKIAKKSGKPVPNHPKKERRASQESYSRSRSRSKSPGIMSPKKLNFEGVDRENEEKSLKNERLKDELDQRNVKKEEEIARKRFVYSSQMIENKEMNKAFDKNSDYWRLGLAMGVYPDMLPKSQIENLKNL